MLPIEVLRHERRGFVHKRLLGGVKGFFSGGGPLGAIRGFVSPAGESRGQFSGPSPGPDPLAFSKGRGRGPLPIQRLNGGGGVATGLVAPGAGGTQIAIPATGGCPSGFHPNKSAYVTAAGFVAKGTKCVRNRRRNLSNGRANTRALRRMAAWDKQERKLGSTLKKIARGR